MAGNDSKNKKIKSLDIIAEEFQDYLKKYGVFERLENTLKMLYEMDERPVDPLEFLRTHMSEVIPERVLLEKLQEEYEVVMQEIAVLQQENVEMTNRLKELQPSEFALEDENIVTNNIYDSAKE